MKTKTMIAKALVTFALVATLHGCATREMTVTADSVTVIGQTGLLVKPTVSVTNITVAQDGITTTTRAATWSENAQPAVDWADVVLGAIVGLVVALAGGI